MICQIRRKTATNLRKAQVVSIRSKGLKQERQKDGGLREWVAYEEHRRTIIGTAVTAHPNHKNYALDPVGGRIGLPLPLLFDHAFETWNQRCPSIEDCNSARIGQVVTLWRYPDRIRAMAVLDDTPAADHAWRLIRAGAARYFSALPSKMTPSGVSDGVSFYDSWLLEELSITRIAENPEATFEPVVRIQR